MRLPETPTSGARWQIDGIEAPVTQVGDSFDLQGTAPGAGGERELRFVVTGPGAGRVALKLWQEWEGESSVSDRFFVLLNVAA